MSRGHRESDVEILKAFAAGDQFFVVISVTRTGSSHNFQFAASLDSFTALKKMFEMRPFDSLPGVKRRYFFRGPISTISALGLEKADKFGLAICIEEGSNSKLFDIACPKHLTQNLLWFQELKDLDEARYLRVETK
jgi:hypothetical protein